MEITGKIKEIQKTVQITERMKKANLILETDLSSQYPQTICVEFTNDSIDYLSQFKVEDFVEIGINLRGRAWVNPQGETKYFNSINGWKISKTEQEITNQAQQPDREVSADLPF